MSKKANKIILDLAVNNQICTFTSAHCTIAVGRAELRVLLNYSKKAEGVPP